MIFLLALTCMAPGIMRAQEQISCGDAIAQATDRYLFADFEKALTLLTGCLDRDAFSSQEQVQAYTLLAQIYEADGKEDLARDALARLFALNPDYEPDSEDASSFIALAEEIQQEVEQAAAREAAQRAEQEQVDEATEEGQDDDPEPQPEQAGEVEAASPLEDVGETSGTEEGVRTVRRQTALMRSLAVPGLGQMYKGQRTKGLVFLVAGAASLGAAGLFLSQVDSDKVVGHEQTYLNRVKNGQASAQQEEAFSAWQDAYDSNKSSRTLGMAALGVAAGVWVLNLIDSASGFSRPANQAMNQRRLSLPEPDLTYHRGVPHYGLRVHFTF